MVSKDKSCYTSLEFLFSLVNYSCWSLKLYPLYQVCGFFFLSFEFYHLHSAVTEKES